MKPWRTPVPEAFWIWAKWTADGQKDPMPPAVRAYFRAHRLKRAPADWKVHFAWVKGKPRPKPKPAKPVHAIDLGIFGGGNGVLFTHPGGDAEIAPALAAAGFRWVMFNVDGIDDREYDAAWQQAERCGLFAGPWARVRKPGDASRVEAIANRRGSPIAGHNLEDEAQTGELTPDMLAAELLHPAAGPARAERWRIVPTLGWVQNDPDWTRLGSVPNLVGGPECFLNFRSDLLPKVCVDHAVAQGFRQAIPGLANGSFSEGPVAVPPATSMNTWPGVFWVYPGNGMDAGAWRR